MRNDQMKHGKSLDPRLRGMGGGGGGGAPIGANPGMDPRLRNQPMQQQPPQQQQQGAGAVPMQIDPRLSQRNNPGPKSQHVIGDPRFDPRSRNQRK